MFAVSLLAAMIGARDVMIGMVGGTFCRRGVIVLMRGSDNAMRMTGVKRRKNEADGQEHEKTGDNAVPFHDSEQRA